MAAGARYLPPSADAARLITARAAERRAKSAEISAAIRTKMPLENQMSVGALTVIILMAAAFPALAQASANQPNTSWPGHREGDYVIKDYKFVSGESLPEVKLHYRTIGTASTNAAGEVVNAVLLLQGNTGTGANWFRPTLAGELFKPGQPLDSAKYYIIMPDALGRGGSSKPPMVSRAISRITATTTWSI